VPARQRLLDAADGLFYSRGIANTAVDDVLARAQVSVATLYAQFGSKDGLIGASLERRLAVWRSLWEDAVAAAPTDEARLLAVFDALATMRERHGGATWCAFLATAAELPDPGHVVRPLIDADTSLLLERLTALAAPVTDEPAALADALLLVYNGTLAAFLRGAPRDPIAQGRALASLSIAAHRRG
jgi:AcrR family transcriptional regulator